MQEHSKRGSRGQSSRIEAESDPSFFSDGSEEYNIPIRDFLQIIWRRLWMITLVACLLTASVVGLSFLQTPEYEASIKILVGQEQGSNGSNNLGQDVQGLQQLTQTVAEVVPTRPVAEDVIEQLELNTTPGAFLSNVTVQQVTETQVVEISYRDTDPARAESVANAIGDVFSERISEVNTNAAAITATVWERAATPGSPVSPDPVRNGLLALVLGGLLGLGLAFLLEQLDDRWRTPEEVERASGVPTFGIVRAFDISKAMTKAKSRAKKGGD